MRRYKTIGVSVCVLTVLFTIFFPYIKVFSFNQTGRYHQHLEAKLRPEDEVDDGTFNTHLPIVSINTNGTPIPGEIQYDENGGSIRDEYGKVYTTTEDGEKMLRAEVKIYDNESVVNRLTDDPAISSDILIRIRGASSREFDKKGYLVKLINEDGSSNAQPVMGMDAHHEWAMHGPFLDKTLIRNYMCYNIAGEMMDYAPNVRFCEAVINGEYAGIYVMTETITAGEDGARLPLTASKKQNTFSGYLLRLDRHAPDSIDTFSAYTYRLDRNVLGLEIKYPGSKRLTEEMEEAIRLDFSDFEKAIYSYDFKEDQYGMKALMDTESFADYFLINEVTCNYDAGWISTYIYKSRDGLYRMVPWDFNNACNNYRSSYVENFGLLMENGLWFNMFTKNEDFVREVVERYRYLRTMWLSDEYLNNYIDETIEYLGPAIERNYQVWGYSFGEEYDALKPVDRNPRTYDEAVDQLKDFLKRRTEWMDQNIEALYSYSAESKIKKFNHLAN